MSWHEGAASRLQGNLIAWPFIKDNPTGPKPKSSPLRGHHHRNHHATHLRDLHGAVSPAYMKVSVPMRRSFSLPAFAGIRLTLRRRASHRVQHLPGEDKIRGSEAFRETAVKRPDRIAGSLDLAVSNPDLGEFQSCSQFVRKCRLLPSQSHRSLEILFS